MAAIGLPQVSVLFLFHCQFGASDLKRQIVTAEQLVSYMPASFEQERGIKVHNNTRVDAIEPGRKRVTGIRVDTGEPVEFNYERLLIATGVKPRIPDIPGTDLKNVFTITTLQDAIHAYEALQSAKTVST